MKIREIKSILNTTCNRFFAGFPDEYKNNFFVAGGITSNLWHFIGGDNGEPYQPLIASRYREMFPGTDLDLYVKANNFEDYNAILAPLKLKYSDHLVQPRKEQVYPHISHTILMRPNCDPDFIVDQVQIIEIITGSPENVVETFDMEHSKIYFDIETDSIFISPAQMNCLKQRKLIFYEGKSRDPIGRKNKWIGRGWQMHKEVPLITYDDNYVNNDEIPF